MGILDGGGAGHAAASRFGGARRSTTAWRRRAAEIRGRELAMIFQNPRAALNPIRPVGRQIADVLRRMPALPAATGCRARAIEMLRRGRASPIRRGAPAPIRSSSRAACASG